MLNRSLKLLTILQVVITYNIILFSECAHKVRYHKAVSVGRKASPQLFFDFVGDSDGDIGDVFGFLSYYDPEFEIHPDTLNEELRNRTQGNESLVETTVSEFSEIYDYSSIDYEVTSPQTTTHRYSSNQPRSSFNVKELKVCDSC